MPKSRFKLLPTLLLVALAFTTVQSAAGSDASELFDKGMNALRGSDATRSSANATDYFRRSAELGYVPAQVVLGYFYDTGLTVTTDAREAFEWYKKAAQQDDPLAEWLVGRMVYEGRAPTRDLNEAQTWLEKSRSHGDPFAEYLLGKVALERRDFAVSASMLKAAAEQGLPQAQRALSELLANGEGAPQSYFEAYVWLLMSYDAGLHGPTADLQALEARLGSTELEKAKTKARQLENTMTRSAVAHGCTGWQGEFDIIPTPPPPDLQRFCRQ